MYSGNIKTLHFEPSQLCNASCVVCNRRLAGGPKNPNIHDVYATLEQVQQWFSPAFISELDRLILCGNYGDPMTNPELLEIIEYFRTHSPNLYITMHTNASGRNSQWWNKLGTLIGTNGDVYFSIDGLSDTNHLYRRGTHWEYIMNAVEGYISSGANAIWDYLIFKHNQHQTAQAEHMSRDLGFKKFIKKTAFGFEIKDSKPEPIRVLKHSGEFDYYIYAKDTLEEREPVHYSEDPKQVFDIHIKSDISTVPTEQQRKMDTVGIDCMSANGNEIYVNAYGLLFPCCFTAGKYQGDRNFVNAQYREFVAQYGDETIDLNMNSLDNIVNSDMFTTGYKESWSCNSIKDGKLLVCAEFCGKYKENIFDKILEDTK